MVFHRLWKRLRFYLHLFGYTVLLYHLVVSTQPSQFSFIIQFGCRCNHSNQTLKLWVMLVEDPSLLGPTISKHVLIPNWGCWRFTPDLTLVSRGSGSLLFVCFSGKLVKDGEDWKYVLLLHRRTWHGYMWNGRLRLLQMTLACHRLTFLSCCVLVCMQAGVSTAVEDGGSWCEPGRHLLSL